MKKFHESSIVRVLNSLQSGMGQDEGSRILLLTMKHADVPAKAKAPAAQEEKKETAIAIVNLPPAR